MSINFGIGERSKYQDVNGFAQSVKFTSVSEQFLLQIFYLILCERYYQKDINENYDS